ncbi:hemerythrin domain-containing protein [Streptomyces sp. YC504]|uniref:Hemerythrin domain-containing protein n=1 Tax=Streptomyces mesophilus TaxID=1775132 RepID=A0A6G4XGZ1_9ACTN|nr:hemerythrin domain-containing protein [Streptomyces mesophilus]NGO76819.1 hemerythrin domain-containing protein [Streptomyces mesophilus]
MTAVPQDVVELILKDHRTMEDLLRLMRSVEADRPAALLDFADLFIAHGEATEVTVHPTLRFCVDAPAEAVKHCAAQHLEGSKILLALLEVAVTGSWEWDWRLEQLTRAVSRHIDDEERTFLNGACEHLSRTDRTELGAAFAAVRGQVFTSGGTLNAVHGFVRDRVPA